MRETQRALGALVRRTAEAQRQMNERGNTQEDIEELDTFLWEVGEWAFGVRCLLARLRGQMGYGPDESWGAPYTGGGE